MSKKFDVTGTIEIFLETKQGLIFEGFDLETIAGVANLEADGCNEDTKYQSYPTHITRWS